MILDRVSGTEPGERRVEGEVLGHVVAVEQIQLVAQVVAARLARPAGLGRDAVDARIRQGVAGRHEGQWRNTAGLGIVLLEVPDRGAEDMLVVDAHLPARAQRLDVRDGEKVGVTEAVVEVGEQRDERLVVVVGRVVIAAR